MKKLISIDRKRKVLKILLLGTLEELLHYELITEHIEIIRKWRINIEFQLDHTLENELIHKLFNKAYKIDNDGIDDK